MSDVPDRTQYSLLLSYLWRTGRVEAESTHSWTSEGNADIHTVKSRIEH